MKFGAEVRPLMETNRNIFDPIASIFLKLLRFKVVR
jgi:hypothetical protein